MKRCVILSACPVSPSMRALLRPGDTVIACDAGYRNCAPLGVEADLVVGDFDSAPQPVREGLVVLPHVKDDTDTQYAAKLAAENGFDEVLLLGALGGKRLEHTLANIATGLWLEKHGVRAVLADENSTLSYVMPGEVRRYAKSAAFYVSVFPLEGRAEGVCIRGAFYPLENAVLTADYPLGVSNEFAPDAAEVEIGTEKGALLVTQTREDRR